MAKKGVAGWLLLDGNRDMGYRPGKFTAWYHSDIDTLLSEDNKSKFIRAIKRVCLNELDVKLQTKDILIYKFLDRKTHDKKKAIFIRTKNGMNSGILARATKLYKNLPAEDKISKPNGKDDAKIKEVKAAMRKLGAMKSVKTYIGLAKKLAKLQG